MKHYYDTVLQPATVNGAATLIPAVGVSIQVNQQGTLTPATIYSDDGVTIKINPAVTDANGRFDFYIPNGRYDLVFSGVGIPGFTQFNVEITDAMDTTALGKTVIAFTANNTHSGNETFSGTMTSTGGMTTSQLNGCIVVDGVTYARTNAGIQSAVNAAGANGCVYLPVGTYALTATAGEQIKITQPLNFICAGWGANLQLQSGAGSIPLLHIAPSGVSGFVGYGIRVQDCQFSTAVAGLGTYAIQVDTATTGSISKLVIEHVYAGCSNTGLFLCTAGSGFGTGSIAFNNPTGTGGLFDTGIYRSILYGNVSMIKLGDAVSIQDNQFFQNANNDVFYVDFFPGSTIFQLQHNTMEIPFQAGCVTSGSAAMNGGIIEQNAWEPQNTSLTGSNGAMLDLNGCATSNVTNVKIKNNSFQLSANSSTLNAVRLNFATQTDVGGRAGENQFFLTTGGTCAAATCHALITTANAANNRFNHNIYNITTWTGASGSIFDDVAANTNVTEDTIFNGGVSPLIFQASGGGTLIYGFNGVGISMSNNAMHISDSTVAANDAIITSSVPLNVTIPSGMQTGWLAARGTAAGLSSSTGACSTRSSQLGGAWAGQVTCTAATAASTLVIVPGVTAQNGWSCWANDLTTAANILRQSVVSTTSCTIAGTVNANDVLTFGAVAY